MADEQTSNGAGKIRRGQGLRLSSSAPAEPEAPTPPADAIRRGQGLRLSTSADAESPAPLARSPGMAAPSAEPRVAPALREVLVGPRTVDLAHGPVAYRRAGDGPPLLLVHGWGASSRYWLPTIAAFAATRTVYALDLPGYGESHPLGDPPGLARLAQALLEFADALGLQRFELVGHSYGASVAALAAAQAPARVLRLALTSFGIGRNAAERDAMAALRAPLDLSVRLGAPLLSATAPLVDLWRPLLTALACTPPLPQLLASWYLASPPAEAWLLHEGVIDLMRMDLRAHLGALASVGDPAVPRALAGLQLPTLLITGAADRVSPPDSVAAAAALVAGGRAVVIEGCGHVPMIEQPAAYHAVLREFLGA